MANLPASEIPSETRTVSLLVLEDEPKNAGVLRQILDSEGWRVRVVSDLKLLHAELRTAEYSLLIANAGLVGLDTLTFHVLRELATVPVDEGGRIRVLFIIPELAGAQYVSNLETNRLPYVIRPFHFHDFLEKVSDLLVEVRAIDAPLRLTRYEFGDVRKKRKQAQANRITSMFASRDSYTYTEEELAEYERQEQEASKNRRSKPRIDLGDPQS